VQVRTAVPAFIGYTARATEGGTDYTNVPVRIESLPEFMKYFGKPDPNGAGYAPESEQQIAVYHLTPTTNLASADITFDGKAYYIEPDPATVFYLYNSIKFFYANGGGACYVVSVGSYGSATGSPKAGTDALVNPNFSVEALTNAIDVLDTQADITMVLIPDATLLSAPDYQSVVRKMLSHCGTAQSRVAILDVPGAAPDPTHWRTDIAAFRSSIGADSLSYGVAYYPFLRTTIVHGADINFNHLGGSSGLMVLPGADQEPLKSLLAAIDVPPGSGVPTLTPIETSLLSTSAIYSQLHDLVLSKINVLPPSAALAGIYTTVDNSLGVWKAPANISVNSVTETTLRIDNDMQSELNMDAVSGKSINAIRNFTGRGVLVWGARTLDGNSSDWRYINVRRTVIMIEQSIKLALQACAFESNDLATWIRVRQLIQTFLTGLWQQGALAGSTPKDAFAVQVGLGATMTDEDIVQGIMKISVLVALTRPGEFIVITFAQQMHS
jgi:phage tail sheath protein FI